MENIDYNKIENYIKEGDLDLFKAALKNFKDKDIKPYQLMEVAINYGRDNFVDYLLNENYSARNDIYGHSVALFRDLENNNSPILKKLLDSTDINERNAMGMTPLIYASYLENSDAVDMIINNKGLDINAIDRYGMSALTYCCLNGNFKIAQKLINNKIKIISLGNQHDDIYYAVIKNHPDLLNLLIRHGIDVNHGHKKSGISLMVAAAKAASPEILTILIDNGGEVDYIDKYKNSALLEAAKRYDGWQYEMCELLLKRGADINVQTPNGDNIKNIAKVKNDIKLIEMLENYKKEAPKTTEAPKKKSKSQKKEKDSKVKSL